MITITATCFAIFTFGFLLYGVASGSLNNWKYALVCSGCAFFTTIMQFVLLVKYKNPDEVFWMFLSLVTAFMMLIHSLDVKSKRG